MTTSFPVMPMKASLGSMPDGDEWAFEIKWDGYRTIVHVFNGDVRLQSAAGHDVTSRWPELNGIASAVNANSAILDGELLVFDDDGRPRFDLVQRSGVGASKRVDEPRREAAIHLFDVLEIDGTDTTGLDYLGRRQLLSQLIEPGPNWLVPAHQIGDGTSLLTATREQDLEGVIAKRINSVWMRLLVRHINTAFRDRCKTRYHRLDPDERHDTSHHVRFSKFLLRIPDGASHGSSTRRISLHSSNLQ
jgi:bifunctional non-homologous end joining protein LigD